MSDKPVLPAEDVAAFEFYRDAFKRGDIDAIVNRLKESGRRRAQERYERTKRHNDGRVPPNSDQTSARNDG